MVYREAEEPPLLPWREAGVLDGAGLAILLTRHVLAVALPFMVCTPAQCLALRANQVAAVIDEVTADPRRLAGWNWLPPMLTRG